MHDILKNKCKQRKTKSRKLGRKRVELQEIAKTSDNINQKVQENDNSTGPKGGNHDIKPKNHKKLSKSSIARPKQITSCRDYSNNRPRD